MRITKITLATAVLVIAPTFLVACSSPPQPPTVDDSRRRPVNSRQALQLQACRSELSTARIALADVPVSEQTREPQPTTPAPTAETPSGHAATDRPARNQVFVIPFARGSADLHLSAAEAAQLVEQARTAQYVVIRGRTDAVTDSMAETRLARRRAEAAHRFLVEQGTLRYGAVRLAWQGAGDLWQADGQAPDRLASRRVEIELYPFKPVTRLVTQLTTPLDATDSPVRAQEQTHGDD